MPIGPTHTKAQKQRVVHTEMKKFSKGDLHSGSKNGPVVTNPAQAKAIAMSESKQSKSPSKRKGYDRSGHFPGNPGFNREGKPPYGNYDAGAHAKQPKGQSIGIHDPGVNQKQHTEFGAEMREHFGKEASGGGHERNRVEVANTGPADRGTSLVENCGMGEAKQPHGKSIGAGGMEGAEHHRGHGMGPAHTFKMPPQGNSHTFPGTHKRGFHRVSGNPGAHMIGHRGK